MTKKDREIVFNKYDGKCAYCGDPLVKGWHVDHLKAIVRNQKYDYIEGKWKNDGTCMKPENECMENYMPACASCNIMKSSSDLERFREVIGQFIQSLNQYSTQYKFAKRYGLIQEQQKPVVFYFETL